MFFGDCMEDASGSVLNNEQVQVCCNRYMHLLCASVNYLIRLSQRRNTIHSHLNSTNKCYLCQEHCWDPGFPGATEDPQETIYSTDEGLWSKASGQTEVYIQTNKTQTPQSVCIECNINNDIHYFSDARLYSFKASIIILQRIKYYFLKELKLAHNVLMLHLHTFCFSKGNHLMEMFLHR